jgi:hypothetical protein
VTVCYKAGAEAPAPAPPTPAPVFSSRTHMGGVLAYLDPGSGSLILQAIVGGAAAVAVMGKIYWRRLLGFLRIRRKEDL